MNTDSIVAIPTVIITKAAPRSEAWYKRNIESYRMKEGYP